MRSIFISFILLVCCLATAAQTSAPDVATLKTKAAAGDAKAQIELGHAYEDGNGVPQNDELAVKWYRAAAEQGSAVAQNDLGVMYRLGHGVNKNITEAQKWFRMAAKQGYAPAMFNLGTVYYNDQEMPADDKLAYAWFVLADKAGSKPAAEAVQRLTSDMPAWKMKDAKVVLADMLFSGNEVKTDIAQALAIYDEVATQDASVAVRVAKLYIFDPHAPRDYSKAERYCSYAAARMYAPGMVCLAFLNAAGFLGPDREPEAFSWLEKAARLGSPIGAFGAGRMYAEGWGTKRDLDRAYTLLLMAQEARVEQAGPVLASVSAELGPDRTEKLHKKVREQQKKIYDPHRLWVHVVTREDLEFPLVVTPPGAK